VDEVPGHVTGLNAFAEFATREAGGLDAANQRQGDVAALVDHRLDDLRHVLAAGIQPDGQLVADAQARFRAFIVRVLEGAVVGRAAAGQQPRGSSTGQQTEG